MRPTLVIFVLLTLATAASAQAPGPASAKRLPNQGLEVVQRYSGPALMARKAPDAKEPAPLVITSQEEFEDFLTQLPAIDVDRGAGTNPDPMKGGPLFDWSRFMLLVIFDSQSLHFPPSIGRVEVKDGALLAVVEYPDTKNLIETKPPEYGAYGAALVLRSGLPLAWDNPGHRAQEAQRQSMMMFLPKTE